VRRGLISSHVEAVAALHGKAEKAQAGSCRLERQRRVALDQTHFSEANVESSSFS